MLSYFHHRVLKLCFPSLLLLAFLSLSLSLFTFADVCVQSKRSHREVLPSSAGVSGRHVLLGVPPPLAVLCVTAGGLQAGSQCVHSCVGCVPSPCAHIPPSCHWGGEHLPGRCVSLSPWVVCTLLFSPLGSLPQAEFMVVSRQDFPTAFHLLSASPSWSLPSLPVPLATIARTTFAPPCCQVDPLPLSELTSAVT